MLIHLMALFIAMLTSVSIGLAQAEVRPDHAKRMAKGLAVFRDGVGQALKQRCVKCHGGGKIRGDSLNALKTALIGMTVGSL